MGSVHPNPAIQDNRCHFVLVDGAVPTGPMKWDHDEEIQVSAEGVPEVLALARKGVSPTALLSRRSCSTRASGPFDSARRRH